MLDPAVLAAVADLELVARVTVDGAVAGLHESPFHGHSAEFTQYRHYHAGDDLKHVDWKLLARTDRVYTKQHLETTNLLAQLVVDGSASMSFRGSGPVSKLEYARVMAAALAHLLIRQGDAVGLIACAGDRTEILPSRRGHPHLRRVLVALSRLEAKGGPSGAAPFRGSADELRGRGLIFLLSDLYDDDEPFETELRRAARIGHDVVVLQILTRDELEFPFRDDVELEDLESHRRVPTGPGAAAGYRREMAAFLGRWRARCVQEGIDYATVTTDTPPDCALRDYLLRRTHQGQR